MVNRRTMLGSAAAALLFKTLATAENAPAEVKQVFLQDLPDVALNKWTVTAVEVNYPPGGASKTHRHPGFVLGYVLEGEIRFQLRGGPLTTYRAGEMFYEAPGSVHAVSANASKNKRAKILAMVFAEKGKPITTPA